MLVAKSCHTIQRDMSSNSLFSNKINFNHDFVKRFLITLFPKGLSINHDGVWNIVLKLAALESKNILSTCNMFGAYLWTPRYSPNSAFHQFQWVMRYVAYSVRTTQVRNSSQWMFVQNATSTLSFWNIFNINSFVLLIMTFNLGQKHLG